MPFEQSESLRGKVAIITGAGRGIGRSVALTFVAHGASVVLAARTKEQLDSVAGECGGSSARAFALPTDMAEEKQIIALVAETIRLFGRIDMVINNAGMGIYGPLEHVNAADWDRIMAVNARGPLLLCREAIPHLRRQRPSFIVNITSVVGLKGYHNQSVYSASKHAVMGWTKSLAREMQGDGIRVHAICPGAVDTELATAARPDIDRSQLIAPQEIADITLFLVTRRGTGVIDMIGIRRESSVPWE